MRWVSHTEWPAIGGEFSPDGKQFTYVLNADGRASIRFVDRTTLEARERKVPPGLNFDAASPFSYVRDGTRYFSHQDPTHPADFFKLALAGEIKQLTQNESAGLASASLTRSVAWIELYLHEGRKTASH